MEDGHVIEDGYSLIWVDVANLREVISYADVCLKACYEPMLAILGMYRTDMSLKTNMSLIWVDVVNLTEVISYVDVCL